MSGFFHSTEFYVIASMAAAAVVGLCVRPPSRGEAIERLLAGTLCRSDSNDPEPRVTISCPEDGGPVLLTRSGLAGLTSAGAVSLAVTVTGTAVAIAERPHRLSRSTPPYLLSTSCAPDVTTYVTTPPPSAFSQPSP